ncbi:protein RDM16 [Juglans microcarpa x Juglans regia]|uniref:protein RDM16 n=1 Tax=Juglans microcarpa x Juglans regia TaxID=2249226 RepID=UPI001B7F0FE4|nr:protein RDM16 [Juglans microcarpa x Juglans regia]
MESSSVPESYFPPSHPIPTKVSSISTTNENKGVSITRSHEVPGKSSTDGTSSAAGKSGSLSLDALAKAKKALQMQKDLSEKLKKIPFVRQGTIISTAPTNVSEGMTSTSLTLPSASAAAFVKPPFTGPSASVGITTLPNIEAVKRAQELAARMGFRQDPEFAPLINLFPGQTAATEFIVPQKPTKAPVLRLDALGREIDEHGNVVNATKPSNLSTLKVNINKQKKEAFQILRPELDVDPETNPHFDERMGIDKTKLLRPKRMTFQFVEEGKWSKEAEHIKLKSKFGEAQAKEQKAKQAQLAKANAAPDINPNLIEVAERVIIKEKPKDTIPEIEWWDATLLQAGAYGDITDGTMVEDKLKKEKITIYVEHPRPIEPPAEPAPPPPQPLKLTKKEQKKLRTQRRLAREKDKQEMIRQGLIEPPKPKVKMSNLMKVLGSEATQDPTRLEKEIRSAAAEREQAHIDRNIARKLTPAERREKKERKLFDEPNTVETNVSVYRINDLSHLQTRFKIDVNAQENRLTGCAVISDGITVVVVEGGNKSIKRYGKLMLRRINWATAVKEEDEDGDESDDKPANRCVLVWQGSVAKSSFNRFTVHECMTEAAARKIFADAGVAHHWELAINFSDDQT